VLGHGEKISRKQDLAIAALLEMPTTGAAAKAAGVSEQTLWRWMQVPGFQSQYRVARQRTVEQAIARLQQVAGEAVGVLREIMMDPQNSATPPVLAARSILEFSLKAAELDLTVRVEELERRLEADTEPQDMGAGAYLPNYANQNGGA
jgi:hypothetical protein